MVFGGVGCAGAAMLNIPNSSFMATIRLFLRVVIGIVGVDLRRACKRSATACIYVSSDGILGTGRLAGKNSVVLEAHSFTTLGMKDVWQR